VFFPRRFIKFTVVLAVVSVMLLLTVIPASAQTQRIHIVRPGETLASIAATYNTSVAALAAANNIVNVNRINVGQHLIIPMAVVINPQTYVVQRGDTLREIARRFNTTVDTLVQLNRIVNPNRIFPGQVLIVPAGGPVVPPPTTPPTTVGGRYQVRHGDTLAAISRRFGVDMWNIARANNIFNLNRIFAGQWLIIPGR
jgi:spore germination protein